MQVLDEWVTKTLFGYFVFIRFTFYCVYKLTQRSASITDQ